jgi:hypothetical protein
LPRRCIQIIPGDEGVAAEIEVPSYIESGSMDADFVPATSYEMQGTTEQPDVDQHLEFLAAAFQPPPIQSTETVHSILRDDEMRNHLPNPTEDLIISDSGYGSEQLYLCNCPGPCGCSISSSRYQDRNFGGISVIDGSGAHISEMQWMNRGEDS